MDFSVFISQEWMLIALLLVLVVVLVFTENKKGAKSLNLHETTRLVNKGEAVIIDVRERKEFTAGHITDAIHVPHTKVADSMALLEKHKTKTIIVVDKMGQHAGNVAKVLTENGFNSAKMAGGMAEWNGQSLPVIKA